MSSLRLRIDTQAGDKLHEVKRSMKNWEIIADNLSKAGWSWGCVSAIDSDGRTIWIADARRDDGKRFVVRADEKTAFMELESVIRATERPDDCGAREIPLDNCRGSSMCLLDFVIRQFHLIFGTVE